MKRIAAYLAISILTFAIGVTSGALWYKHKQSVRSQTDAEINEPLRPLTPAIVSRALQTRGIATNNLRRNGDNEVVWRWLKQSIAEYPQEAFALNITEKYNYGVRIYNDDVLDASEFNRINGRLKQQGLPLLRADKRYAEINIRIDGIICPEWSGLVDLEEAKLVFFEGFSG